MNFVTGGTGFLGTHLIRQLVLRGNAVRALKRSSSRIFLEKEISDKVEWVEGNVLNIPSLEEAMKGCEKVYHCAAIISFLPKDREDMMRVNVEGTANVVNIALEAGVKKLLHVSSVAAIGRSRGDEVIHENTPWEDSALNSNYAISKFLSEREVWRGIAEGLNAVIVNPSLIIGPGDWNDGPPNFFTMVWKNLYFYTNGGTGLVDVHDVATTMIQLMESDIQNDRFIINADHWQFRNFFFTIADLLKKRRPFINVRKWMLEALWRIEMIKHSATGLSPLVTRETARIAGKWSRFDNSKVKEATGFEFTPIQKCLEETAEKFLKEWKEKGKSTNITS